MNNEEIKITPIKMDNGIGFKGAVTMSNEEIEKRVDFMEEHMKEFNTLVIKAENELYIKELLKRNELLRNENQQLKENYDRIYNENCKLREEHNITDISLLDENQQLKKQKADVVEYIKNNTKWFDSEYTKIYGELCTCEGTNSNRLEIMENPSELLRMLGEIDE